MGTEIQGYDLSEADFKGEEYKKWNYELKGNNDILSITKPELIKEIHANFINAGADIIETNTFNSNATSQSDYGLENIAYELNFQGAKIAKETAIESSKKVLVAGVLGPTNRTASLSPDVEDPSARNISFDELKEDYKRCIDGLIDGGSDILMIETIFDTLNAKAAIFSYLEKCEEMDFEIPLMISGTISDASGRTLSGQTIDAFWTSVEHAKPVSIGFNCALGAEQLRPHVKRLSEIADVAISVHPNAGLPNEMGSYDQSPSEMASSIRKMAKNNGVNIIGGCCGTTPAHISRIARTVKKMQPKKTSTPFELTLKLSGLEEYACDGKN